MKKSDSRYNCLRREVKLRDKITRERVKGIDRATKIYNKTMDAWKEGHNEWKSRMEQLTTNTITRREAWIFIVAVVMAIIAIWSKLKT